MPSLKQLTDSLENKYGLYMYQAEIAEATRRSKNNTDKLTEKLDVFRDGRYKKYFTADVAKSIMGMTAKGYTIQRPTKPTPIRSLKRHKAEPPTPKPSNVIVLDSQQRSTK